ncbi:MAG TPA: protein kinase [Pyrinomonadaceae bacterium]
MQDRYRVVRQLGRGGMGAVYEAMDERLSRSVALKETLAESDELKRAFEREARLLANLRHPALPKVIDHFTEGGGQFLVMEFIQGSDLASQLERNGHPFPPEEVRRWTDELLDALEYLHTHEPPIIHRDIKPSNLKLTAQGRIILLDFGLAKGAAGQMTHFSTGISVIGYTLHYASLEQIQGERTSPRSDLYSLAATIYHLLTGRVPVDALKRAADLLNDDADPLPPIRTLNPNVPEQLASVLSQALSLKPSLRPASAAEMRAALHADPLALQPEDDELTRVSPSLPAPNGDKTLVMPKHEAALPVGPDAAADGALEALPLADEGSNAKKWWLIGGGVCILLLIVASIVVLSLRSRRASVTPATSPTAMDAVPSPYREALGSVAAVTMFDVNGRPLRTASGFFVRPDEIATTLAALDGAMQGRITLVGQGGSYEVTGVTGMDREYGLATLKVARAKAPPLAISNRRQTMMGEKVALLGGSANADPVYAMGTINGYRDDDRLEINAPAGAASPGGPLLNERGEVVAILSEPRGASSTLAVPVNHLVDLTKRKQQPMSLAAAGARDVLYDWRKYEAAEAPNLAREVEQKVLAEVARAHAGRAPAEEPAKPQPTPQADAGQPQEEPRPTPPQAQDEMRNAVVSAVAGGAFTTAGAAQTAYIIDTRAGDPAKDSGPKYLAIFNGENYVTDFAVPNYTFILRTFDLNRDGVNELLLGYHHMQMGAVVRGAKLVQVSQGRLRVIRDFGNTYLSFCDVGLSPDNNPTSAAAVAFFAASAVGQMPEIRVDNYLASCPAEGVDEQWKYTPANKLPDVSGKPPE